MFCCTHQGMGGVFGVPFWILCVVSTFCGMLNVRTAPSQSSQPQETHPYIEQIFTAATNRDLL